MHFEGELSQASNETIEAALKFADIPALLPALAAALGDLSLVPDDLQPQATGMMDPSLGLTPEQHAKARSLALRGLKQIRDHGTGQVATPEVSTLRQLLGWAAGGAPVDDYLELLREELGIGDDLRRPNWNKSEVSPDRPFRVAIIGAGMSGLAAAYRCQQAGLDVVVLEKNPDLGGTWFENTYPGCRVDVSNLFYSYSFAQRNDWPEHYSSQEVLLDYFRSVAESGGLEPLIQFGTEVEAMSYDDDSATWSLEVLRTDGTEEALEAQAVVSAVGQLNRPNFPDIPGIDQFGGPTFHSARWDDGVDLAGKRVAVIGTGASAAQFIPVIAEQAAHLTVFQRTPAWFIPSPQYTDAIGAEVAWLRRNVPGYTNWSRFWTFWRNVEGMMPMATVDPEWDAGEESVSAANNMMREFLTAYLHNEFADRPDLSEKVVPHYPPFSKRFILDNGAWARTLKRDNVSLITEPIEQITADGVHTEDHELHEADVIIYGTGFKASDFLTPMKVTGRGGRDLHESWAGDARAYLGLTLPGFPNFFMLYGPNTNIVVNGSIIYFSECGVNYIVGAIGEMLKRDIRAIDPKVEIHDAYNAEVDAENLRMAWGVSTVNSWYKNTTGRTAQNWPFTLLDYWQRTRQPDFDDYELL